MSLEFSQELDTPIISPSYAPQDAGEIGLRPKLLGDYTGQEKAKGNLAIYIEAARRRNEPLDHTLLYGPRYRKARRPGSSSHQSESR